MAPTGSHRGAQLIAGGTAVVMLASMVMAGTAPADPIVDARTEAAALARTIDAQGRQMEQLAEQYDGARLHAGQTDRQLAAAELSLTAAAKQEADARAALNRQAIEAYVHDGYLSPPRVAPLSGSVDPAVQSEYFSLATGNEVATLAQVRAAERALSAQRAVLVAAQRDARAALVALDGRRQAVVEADAAAKATLGRVQGQLVVLVAQQQAQLEAARVAQEQQALAAAQAQAAAARAAAAQAQAAAQARAAANARTAAAAAAAAAAARAASARRQVTTTVATTTAPGSPAPKQGPPAGPPVPPGSSRGLVALAFARSQLGKPYEWGAAGPDTYDCSGLTMRAWEAAGVEPAPLRRRPVRRHRPCRHRRPAAGGSGVLRDRPPPRRHLRRQRPDDRRPVHRNRGPLRLDLLGRPARAADDQAESAPHRCHRRVSTSAPASVTSRVCSNWAVRRPSAVTAVQPSSHSCSAPGADGDHRLDGEDHPGLHDGATPRW